MRHFLFATLLSTSAFACMAEEPMNGGEPAGPDAGTGEEPVEDRGVPLSFAGLPPQTYWDTVPVHGQGPVDGSVIIEGSNGSVAIELGKEGSFCLDVPLAKGQVNTLTLVAIDANGERSEPQAAEVLQDGVPPAAGDPTPARNIALGGLPIAASTVSVYEGEIGALTDGVLSTSTVLMDHSWYYDWLTLQLPVADGVEKIRVYSDINCPMEEYLVHTATAVVPDMTLPGNQDLDEGPWTFRGHFGSEAGDINATNCSTSDYACQEYSFASAVVGAIGIRFESYDCWTLATGPLKGLHRVHEIQAWSPQGVAPPSIAAPSCLSGL